MMKVRQRTVTRALVGAVRGRASTPSSTAPTHVARVAITVAAALLVPISAAAADLDPITCWWRTSVAAVHVGQPFDVVLTCAVLEAEEATVVPDESRLDPGVVQLPPFELLGGRHAKDLHVGPRRFLQYEYTLRVFTDDAFGRDVALPAFQIPFRVNTRVNGESVQGRSRSYVLPSMPVRVLSLVPVGAADIRDAPDKRFADIETRLFRANVLTAVAGVLLAVAAAIAVATLVRTFRRSGSHKATPARFLVSDNLVLRAVGRELSTVRRRRNATGWTDALAARASAALRIAGAYAVGQDVNQIAVASGAQPHAGQLLVRSGVTRTRRIAVSAATTSGMIAHALETEGPRKLRRDRLEELRLALGSFTTAQYGQTRDPDGDALDRSLRAGARLVRRLTLEHWWRMGRLKRGRGLWVR